jgi:two-component system chemotaxis sensor kinase CheA
MSEDEVYRKLFVAESRENHENIVQNLLILEEGVNGAAIDEIFRSAHTLKGMSASMGFHEMERLCHSMEDVFHLIRNGCISVHPQICDLLLACTDRVEGMLDDIEAGGDSSSVDAGDLALELNRYANGDAGGGTDPGEAADSARYRVTVRFADSCVMKDLRALLVLQNLEELGAILHTIPTAGEIDEGVIGESLIVELESDAGRDAILSASGGPDIVGVEIEGENGAQATEPDVPSSTEPPAPRSDKPEKSRELKNIRVEIQRLDHMMNLVEDLVINGGRLKQIARKYQAKEMDEALNMISRSISDLQNLMMHIRMIPLNQIFNRFPRVVRDVAHFDRKDVEFVMEGGETELDRSVMDNLSDPLLHLIRNAVNHGIETPAERARAGKPPRGTLRLSARREQGNVIIEIGDDGGGIDSGRVLAKAIERGLITREASEHLTDEEIVGFLFQPGFSTADAITDISGRGVGLDVVKSTIESLNGSIKVESAKGRGTKFTLVLPPTMAIVEVMMVRINDRRCAIPINAVVEVASADMGGVHRIGGSEAILLRDEVLQIYRLDEMFGGPSRSNIVVVVQYRGRKCCIPVDLVEGQQEVVVKPVSSVIGNCRGVGGVTIPGDGDVVPILDVNTMV